ncbi:COR domain-containing protein [Chryseobacterium sp. GVT01B]|uniref:COR domain-containing protein n=1 Tax=Chryseobacterium sp. GVT01B TaxID=2862675 RepID=UPI001CBEE14A|nr:COR domain-containing protein [Chryseobacterium sp. GVT01B]
MNNTKNIEIAIERIRLAKQKKNNYLNLSGLRLLDIPEDISNMDYLIELDLSYNFLPTLPEMVAKMRYLKILNLKNNYLTNIDFIYGVYYAHTYINISNNLLYDVPESLTYLNYKTEIDFQSNPFISKLPEALVDSSIQRIKDYFDLIKNYDNREKLYETKLIFVGKGEVGKTTLMKVLKNNKTRVIKGKEDTTHGINIDKMNIDVYFPANKPHYTHHSEADNLYQKKLAIEIIEDEDKHGKVKETINYFDDYVGIDDLLYDFDESERVYYLSQQTFVQDLFIHKDVKINLWDFGGQEIYYSTHQFFLTKRSIYVFVWEPRKDDSETDFEYWLNTIKLLGQSSPILVVMNKCDIRHGDINEKTYRQLYSNIHSFHQVSCLKKIGIKKLNNAIEDCIKNMNHLGDTLPLQWIEIRKRLNKIKKDYVNYTEFKNICKKSNLQINKNQLDLVSEYLHDIGDIIHFKADTILKNIIIINPQWATKAVYSLIDCIPIQKNNGVFNYSDLESYLNTDIYPTETHHQLLQLMEKFAICFKAVGAQNLYIVPELLKSNITNELEIREFKIDGALNYRVKFNFMPKGLMSRLICKLFYLLGGSNNYWKNGAVLNYEMSKALVITNNILKVLDITVIGVQKRDLLTLIRTELSKIYSDFNLVENQDIYEEIPCNCEHCQKSEPYFFRYNVLRKFIEKDKFFIDCHKSAISVEISKILNLYRSTKPEEKLIYKLLTSISQLQGLSAAINNDEDSRNVFISNQLSYQGIISKDQARWGKSARGIKQGELDIKIEQDGVMSIFEGMNLSSLKTSDIDSHIIKIINKYDVNGLPEKYLGIYYTGKNFKNFSVKYLKYIQEFDKENIKFNNVYDETKQLTPYTEIKVFKSYYSKTDSEISLTHILINMI